MIISNPTEKKLFGNKIVEKYIFGRYAVYAEHDYHHNLLEVRIIGPSGSINVNGLNALTQACGLAYTLNKNALL